MIALTKRVFWKNFLLAYVRVEILRGCSWRTTFWFFLDLPACSICYRAGRANSVQDFPTFLALGVYRVLEELLIRIPLINKYKQIITMITQLSNKFFLSFPQPCQTNNETP